jgi:tartrate dehydrogenase/decarboxylase/D-malate dehydrogenase
MNEYKIALLPGDGIGKEVAPEGVKVLNAASMIANTFRLHWESFEWGCSYFISNGSMMPEDGLEILEDFDAIYFGAVGFPTVPDYISLRGLRLAICQGFDQYANVRPSALLPGINGPLRARGIEDIDFVVVRENTEGEYSGAGGRIHIGKPTEVATQTAVFTRKGVERIAKYAFEMANRRDAKHLIGVTKSNAQEYIFQLWEQVIEEKAREYPEVSYERVLVDAMAARLVLHPETVDVIVASNLHADILTDLAGALCGSLGVAPSANLNPEKIYPSMFEPIHGSAPDIFGQGIANPIGMIWSGAMMLEYLGQKDTASMILSAIKSVTKEGRILTPDLGGKASTSEVGDAVVEKMQEMGL